MTLPSFEVADTLAAHELSRQTRLVDSVVPEPTDIPIDPDALRTFAQDTSSGAFTYRGVVRHRPINIMEGVKIVFSEAGYDTTRTNIARVDNHTALEMARLVAPIDAHFRGWAGTPDHVDTAPRVNLITGFFEGKTSEIKRHLDFKGGLPHVSYKIYFEGDPDHAPVYYPGLHKIPSQLTQLGRVLGGVRPDTPIPKFNRRESTQHVAPAGVVCVEPWNAVHSGPRVKEARGTYRGTLSVAYILSRQLLPTPNLVAEQR